MQLQLQTEKAEIDKLKAETAANAYRRELFLQEQEAMVKRMKNLPTSTNTSVSEQSIAESFNKSSASSVAEILAEDTESEVEDNIEPVQL
jgi:hypothetical protein